MEEELDKAILLLRAQVEAQTKKKDASFDKKYAFFLAFLNTFFNLTPETKRTSLTQFRNISQTRFTRTLPAKYLLLKKANPNFLKLFGKDWDLPTVKANPETVFPKGISYYAKALGYSLKKYTQGDQFYFSLTKLL